MLRSKKLVSLVMALVMAVGLVSPALATSGKEATIIASNQEILDSEENYTIEIKGEDYDNGDACFYMIQNNRVIFKSYVDRNMNQVINTDYITGKVTYDSYAVSDEVANSAYAAAGNYKYVGKIGYNYYMQGVVVGQRYISLSCKQSGPTADKYVWAGKYANLAELASLVAGYYALPAAVAIEVSKDILSYAGFSFGATAFVLSKVTVDSQKETSEWLATSPQSSRDINISGEKQTFKIGGKTRVHYIDIYYTPQSFTSRNTTFAHTCYELMWGNDQHDIISWS